jgi:hypothetical protein
MAISIIYKRVGSYIKMKLHNECFFAYNYSSATKIKLTITSVNVSTILNCVKNKKFWEELIAHFPFIVI